MERWPKPEAESPCGANYDDHPSRSSLDYSTPLRSVRGNAITSPSPFYKLSSELSRESLRIPGAVPFMWEQIPGRRKFAAGIVSTPPHGPPKPAVSESSNRTKPSLASLFQQPNLECQRVVAGVSPLAAKSPVHPQIAQPPALEHPRYSSAHYSTVQRNMPESSTATKSAFNDEFTDAASDSASDALTATAGGVSVDDSIMLSGPLRPASTPSEARNFIMHRFLPAAHTIACESPQTPSRRFLPPGNAMVATPATPSRCNGSFRDFGRVARTESCLVNGPRCKSMLYTSPSSMPAQRRQLLEGSFRSALEEVNDDSSDEEEEEPPSTPKACGIFPFRIRISLQTRHSNNRSHTKHPQHKDQQPQKKSSKPTGCSHTPKRIMDVLREDQSSSYEDESPVHQHRSRHYGDPCLRPPYTNDRYYKESPQPLQYVAVQPCLSDLNNEEASEYGSYYDAPSRFCSPSPAARHLVNARASRASMLSSLLANQKSTISSAGCMDGSPHPAIISTTEQHLLNNSLCYYNMHIAPNSTLPHPHCLTPPPSHVSSSQDSTLSQDHITQVASTEPWNAFSHVHPSEQSTHIINNALYEHEDQQPNKMSDVNHSNMLALQVGGVGGSEIQAGDAKWHDYATCDVNESKSAQNSSNGDDHIVKSCDQDASNGNGGQHAYKGDTHTVSKGDLHAWNAMQYTCRGIHCVENGGLHACHGKGDLQHACHGAHYVCNGDLHACQAAHYVCNNNHTMGNGGVHIAFSRRLLFPPLPKSPTHSWLDKAMPLVVSAANKSPNTSSRLSYMHNKATLPAAEEHGKQAYFPAADSKWEALVKGSHRQPGHLRFSKELSHQQSVVSGGAT